jgi:cytochrome P450
MLGFPPRVPGFWFSNLWRYHNNPFDFLEICRDLGDIVQLRLPGVRTYLIFHPDLIERVLTKDSSHYIKSRITRNLSEALGDGLLLSEGPFWRQQRRLMTPAFHQQQIASYAPSIVNEANRLMTTWQDGEVRPMHRDMMRLTLLVVGKLFFDTDVSSDAAAIGEALDVITPRPMGLFNSGIRIPSYIPTPDNLRGKRALARLDAVVFRIINQRKQDKTERSGFDLLSLLLNAPEPLTDLQLRDEAMTMILAGHETTALAMTYALYLLATDQQSLGRIKQELSEVLQGEQPTMLHYSKLVFTEAVFKETMRLYPPAWGVGREAKVDCMLGEYPVPKKTQVMMLQWATHRDPRFYPEPLAFKPERWLDTEFVKNLPKFAYFPFGGGSRICIGATFAMLEGILLLATLLQRFEFEALSPERPKVAANVTLRPKHDVMMRVRKR